MTTSKSDHQTRVEDFMAKAKQSLPEIPTIPTGAIRLSRARLIMEEAFEEIRALGVNISDSKSIIDDLNFEDLEFYAGGIFDMVEMVDGCCDLKVVTTGTLSACGINDIKMQEIVDLNNLKKFGPGHYINEAGKLIKPPNFIGPQSEILEELRKQGFKD
jgi:predicted HAD superfamily Cof-like phosphohydrolase